jgi:hypothetical protein
MIKTTPIGLANGKEMLSEYRSDDDKNIPIVDTYSAAKGTFAGTLTTLGTQTIVEARGQGGLVLTDLIISIEKKNLSTVTIFFDDGTNTETIMLITLTDAPVNMAIPLNGRWLAWQGADLKITTSLAATGYIAVGFYRTGEFTTLPYDEWIERRDA